MFCWFLQSIGNEFWARTLLCLRLPFCRHRQFRPCKTSVDRRHVSDITGHAACHNAASGAEQPAAFTPAERIKEAVGECVAVVRSGSQKFVPMIMLFFSMAFINTLLDNLKDTLIFTQATGGGAHVVPWLQGGTP